MPEQILIVGKQEDLDVAAEATHAFRRANQAALLIGLREFERVLQRVVRRDVRRFDVRDLDRGEDGLGGYGGGRGARPPTGCGGGGAASPSVPRAVAGQRSRRG